MAWKFDAKFQLRDDQVSFGNLIFDKNGATLVEEALKKIRDDQPVDMEVLRTVLKDWCFTDPEFENLKVEFEKIKEDIQVFKDALNKTAVRLGTIVKTVGASIDHYIIGSTTWLQRFKENKEIAAGLYVQCKKAGCQFDPAKSAEYEKRYFDVVSSSSELDLAEAMLKKQLEEARLSGDPNALQRYVDALVEVGGIPRERAENKARMNNIWHNASGAAPKRVQGEVVTETPRDVMEQPARNARQALVLITAKLLNEWFDEITALDSQGFPAEADTALDILYQIMLSAYRDAGIMTPYNTEIVLDSKQKAWAAAKQLKNILTLNQNIPLLEASSVSVPKERVDTMEHYWKNQRGFNAGLDGYEEVTPEHLYSMVQVYRNQGGSSSVCAEIISFIVSVFNQCDDMYIEGIVLGPNTPDKDVLDWAVSSGCEEALKASGVTMPRNKMYRLMRGEPHRV